MSEVDDMKQTLECVLKMIELKQKLAEKKKEDLTEKRDDLKDELKKYNMKECMRCLDEFMESDDPEEIDMPTPATMMHILFKEVKKIKDKLNM